MFTPSNGEIDSLLERGYRYVESMFEESRRVDPTALVETKEDIYIVTMPQVEAADDEEARDAFRQAVEDVVFKQKPESVTIITEVWWNVLPRLTEKGSAPNRNLRREGVVVHVEVPGESRAAMAEVSRWGDGGCVNEWREVPDSFAPGLTGFLDKSHGIHVN
jgi:hypothetical protein